MILRTSQTQSHHGSDSRTAPKEKVGCVAPSGQRLSGLSQSFVIALNGLIRTFVLLVSCSAVVGFGALPMPDEEMSVSWEYAVVSFDANTSTYTCFFAGTRMCSDGYEKFLTKLGDANVITAAAQVKMPEGASGLAALLKSSGWKYVAVHTTPHQNMITHFLKRAKRVRAEIPS